MNVHLIIPASFLITCCWLLPPPASALDETPPAGADPAAAAAGGGGAAVEMKQIPEGENHRDGFDADLLHYTDQGSGFFPVTIMGALIDSKTGRPFLQNLERFGLVPGKNPRATRKVFRSASSRTRSRWKITKSRC